MTSGTITRNRRYSQVVQNRQGCFSPPVNATVTNLGSLLTKTWLGGDAPTTALQSYRLERYTYRVYNKDGSSYVRRATMKIKTGSIRPPKGEHAYSMTLRDDTDLLMRNSVSTCNNGVVLVTYQSTSVLPRCIDMKSLMWPANEDLSLVGALGQRLGADFNMAVFLGEGREALATIAECSTRIFHAYKALKKGRPGDAQKSLIGYRSGRRPAKSIPRTQVTERWQAERWLELQYAWKPLVNDIYGAAQHFAAMQNRPQSITYRVGRKRSMSPISTSPNYKHSGLATYGKSIKAIITKVDEAGLLGLKDPASLVWELLPFSFVADWVLPVGNYLEALNLQRALTGQYVTSWKYTVAVNHTTFVPNPGTLICPQYSHYDVETQRTVSNSLGVKMPRVKAWDTVMSWTRATSSVALLSGMFPRKR